MCVHIYYVVNQPSSSRVILYFKHPPSVGIGQNRKYAPYYDGILGDFPVKNTVYTPYLYDSGQPYPNARVKLSSLQPFPPSYNSPSHTTHKKHENVHNYTHEHSHLRACACTYK